VTSRLDIDTVYGTLRQRLSRLNHIWKAKFRSKAWSYVRCLRQFVPETGTVFDIGAHHGYWTKEFARIHNGQCRVFAFEPVTYNYSILESVVSRYKNVTAEQYALSNTTGERDIFIPVKERGNVGLGIAHFGEETKRDYLVESIRTITLDEYVQKKSIARIDFVKCDVEGAELLMLKGGQSCLQDFDVTILLEIDEVYTERLAYTPNDIFAFLATLGFDSYRADFGNCSFSPVQEYVGASDYLFTRNVTAP
jgi:FkbM family methyltransferase